MNLKVFIFGISGRMGQEVAKIVNDNPALELIGGYSRENKNLNPDKKADIVIDFSLPAVFDDLEKFLQNHPASLVSGTTGLNDQQMSRLKKLGNSSAVFWSANMSFGVYLMCRLTKMLARYQDFYQFQIEETHHIYKKDKPSGTALIIEEAARLSTQKLEPTHSIRAKEAFGIHRFMARSTNELLEIRHEAFNRGLFAQGAVDISLWLNQQKPDFYSMQDFFKNFES